MVVIWRYSNCQTLSSEVTNEPEPRKDFVKRPTIDICPIIHDGAWPRGRFKGGRVSGEARRQSVGEDDAEDDEESRPGEEEERDDWDASAEQI